MTWQAKSARPYIKASKSVPGEVLELVGNSVNALRRRQCPDGVMAKELAEAADDEMQRFKDSAPKLDALDLESLYRVHASRLDPNLHEGETTEWERDFARKDKPAFIKLGPTKTWTSDEMKTLLHGVVSNKTAKKPGAAAKPADDELSFHNIHDPEKGSAPRVKGGRDLPHEVMHRFGEQVRNDETGESGRIKKRHEDVMALMSQSMLKTTEVMALLTKQGDQMKHIATKVDAMEVYIDVIRTGTGDRSSQSSGDVLPAKDGKPPSSAATPAR